MVDLGELSPVNADGKTEYTVTVAFAKGSSDDLKFNDAVRVYADGDDYVIERIIDGAKVMLINRAHVILVRCEDNEPGRMSRAVDWRKIGI